jgi:hypothetical protein
MSASITLSTDSSWNVMLPSTTPVSNEQDPQQQEEQHEQGGQQEHVAQHEQGQGIKASSQSTFL